MKIGTPPASVDPKQAALLTVRGVSGGFGAHQVLFDVGFDLAAGERLALVGASGSGKTTLSRALAGLGNAAVGEAIFAGTAVSLGAQARSSELRRQIQYVFQNPYRALNPRHTVGTTLATAIRHFFAVSRAEVTARTERALAAVALPANLVDRYPSELSGGERQRVAIARALVCEPRLLICDEITSSLDVSVQATILQLLRGLQQRGLAILFVTHDLGIVRAVADRVLVLREGRVIERGRVDAVLDRPDHADTRRLIADAGG